MSLICSKHYSDDPAAKECPTNLHVHRPTVSPRQVDVAALGQWLDEQMKRERARCNGTDDETDGFFYEGMVDAYKLVYREWVEKR